MTKDNTLLILSNLVHACENADALLGGCFDAEFGNYSGDDPESDDLFKEFDSVFKKIGAAVDAAKAILPSQGK